jgi:hypothetical protein
VSAAPKSTSVGAGSTFNWSSTRIPATTPSGSSNGQAVSTQLAPRPPWRMGVGNVVAGVICADGHLGYAQPVGGVIAYEKQISISGVGFDIGCGNMAVRLDRRSRTKSAPSSRTRSA